MRPRVRASKVTGGDRGGGRYAHSRDETPIEHGVAVTVVTVDDDDEGLLGGQTVRAVGRSIGHDLDRCEVPQRAHHGYEQRVTRRVGDSPERDGRRDLPRGRRGRVRRPR